MTVEYVWKCDMCIVLTSVGDSRWFIAEAAIDGRFRTYHFCSETHMDDFRDDWVRNPKTRGIPIMFSTVPA